MYFYSENGIKQMILEKKNLVVKEVRKYIFFYGSFKPVLHFINTP